MRLLKFLYIFSLLLFVSIDLAGTLQPQMGYPKVIQVFRIAITAIKQSSDSLASSGN